LLKSYYKFIEKYGIVCTNNIFIKSQNTVFFSAFIILHYVVFYKKVCDTYDRRGKVFEYYMNSRLKFKGKIITHLIYPMVLGILCLVAGIYVYTIDMTPGLVIVVSSGVYTVGTAIMYFIHKPVVMRDLIEFAVDYAQVQKGLLRDLAVPYGLVDTDGNLLWTNKEIEVVLGAAVSRQVNVCD